MPIDRRNRRQKISERQKINELNKLQYHTEIFFCNVAEKNEKD